MGTDTTDEYQLLLDSVRASDFEELRDGITLGTICELATDDPDTFDAWVMVTDILELDDDEQVDERRVRVLNLDEAPDNQIPLIEQAKGVYEHVETGRQIAAATDAREYYVPLSMLDALGPLHPAAIARSRRSKGVGTAGP